MYKSQMQMRKHTLAEYTTATTDGNQVKIEFSKHALEGYATYKQFRN